MGEVIITILQYLLNVLLSTLFQIFILFGPLLFLAFLMNLVARTNENLSYRVLGKNFYLYGFGWLGTAVHEMGHAIFAMIFGHRINEVKLFTPRSDSGSLGHVSHSYDSSSIYQTFGNFFIGIGPILLGSTMLYVLTYLLFKFEIRDVSTVNLTSEALTSLESAKALGANIWSSFLNYIDAVLGGPNSVWWKVVILVYLLYSIGSSITLSRPDVSGAVDGFIYFAILLLIFNLITLWMGDFTVNFFSKVSSFFSGFYFIIILSMMVNLIFIVFFLLLIPLRTIISRRS